MVLVSLLMLASLNGDPSVFSIHAFLLHSAIDTGGKFATGAVVDAKFATDINDTGSRWNLWKDVSAGINDSKVAAGIVDSGGKLATSVVGTGGASWRANMSASFWKNSNWP